MYYILKFVIISFTFGSVGYFLYRKNKSIWKTFLLISLLGIGFNIAAHLEVQSSYINGIPSYYRYLIVHLLDICVLLALVFKGFELRKNLGLKFLLKKYWIYTVFLAGNLVFIIISFFFHDLISIYWTLRYILYGMGSILVLKFMKNELKEEGEIVIYQIFKVLFIGVIANLLVASLQLLFQHSLGLQVLGESILNEELTNIAVVNLGDLMLLRGYGFFQHPNILAAYAVFAYLLVFKSDIQNHISPQKLKLFKVIVIITVIVTFSKTGYLAIVLLFIEEVLDSNLKGKKLLKWLAIILLGLFGIVGIYYLRNMQFVQLRLDLINKGYLIVKENGFSSLLGLGSGGFVKQLGQDPILLETGTFFIQPIHNIFLLLIAEWGLFVIAWCAFIAVGLYRLLRTSNYWIVAIIYVILGSFDHYFITTPQGILMGLVILNMALLRENSFL